MHDLSNQVQDLGVARDAALREIAELKVQLKMVEEWNPETETWTRGRSLKVERDTFGMVAAPKKLICPK